ncbi:unnamed protein product, partial [Ectocarpus sp. 4 AP-2014]
AKKRGSSQGTNDGGGISTKRKRKSSDGSTAGTALPSGSRESKAQRRTEGAGGPPPLGGKSCRPIQTCRAQDLPSPCLTTRSFGFPGGLRMFCQRHQSEGMVNLALLSKLKSIQQKKKAAAAAPAPAPAAETKAVNVRKQPNLCPRTKGQRRSSMVGRGRSSQPALKKARHHAPGSTRLKKKPSGARGARSSGAVAIGGHGWGKAAAAAAAAGTLFAPDAEGKPAVRVARSAIASRKPTAPGDANGDGGAGGSISHKSVCAEQGCTAPSRFGWVTSRRRQYCGVHKRFGMVNLDRGTRGKRTAPAPAPARKSGRRRRRVVLAGEDHGTWGSTTVVSGDPVPPDNVAGGGSGSSNNSGGTGSSGGGTGGGGEESSPSAGAVGCGGHRNKRKRKMTEKMAASYAAAGGRMGGGGYGKLMKQPAAKLVKKEDVADAAATGGEPRPQPPPLPRAKAKLQQRRSRVAVAGARATAATAAAAAMPSRTGRKGSSRSDGRPGARGPTVEASPSKRQGCYQRCKKAGCELHASFGFAGGAGHRRDFCRAHALPGMENIAAADKRARLESAAAAAAGGGVSGRLLPAKAVKQEPPSEKKEKAGWMAKGPAAAAAAAACFAPPSNAHSGGVGRKAGGKSADASSGMTRSPVYRSGPTARAKTGGGGPPTLQRRPGGLLSKKGTGKGKGNRKAASAHERGRGGGGTQAKAGKGGKVGKTRAEGGDGSAHIQDDGFSPDQKRATGICRGANCDRIASFGFPGTSRLFCAKHQPGGMVNLTYQNVAARAKRIAAAAAAAAGAGAKVEDTSGTGPRGHSNGKRGGGGTATASNQPVRKKSKASGVVGGAVREVVALGKGKGMNKKKPKASGGGGDGGGGGGGGGGAASESDGGGEAGVGNAVANGTHDRKKLKEAGR